MKIMNEVGFINIFNTFSCVCVVWWLGDLVLLSLPLLLQKQRILVCHHCQLYTILNSVYASILFIDSVIMFSSLFSRFYFCYFFFSFKRLCSMFHAKIMNDSVSFAYLLLTIVSIKSKKWQKTMTTTTKRSYRRHLFETQEIHLICMKKRIGITSMYATT